MFTIVNDQPGLD